ncbi:MAG TPA: O-methyltransferase [Clostridia bacterium]|nr:O-methyltransferase [Clostridia bacterium]HPQ47752.1 O-methyltransferase [Clostridia bacterium]HRX41515.1 O-methyltransferase [Clostridia bacterium]
MSKEKRFCITDQRVEDYIRGVLRPYEGITEQISEGKTHREHPTADTVTLRLLEIMVRTLEPERILEIGTANGRSTIILANATGANCRIDTIEVNFEAAEKAVENFKKAGVDEKINMIAGDAVDVLDNLDRKYDLIFIDAAKGQYVRYYDLCSGMTVPGGIIFADNVLYRGMTAGGARINRRQQLLVSRLREYIEKAVNDDRFITDILPVGDGVCISYRKKDSLD